MIPRANNGWSVPAGARAIAVIICVPNVLIGLFLTLSFYFLAIGLPVFVLSIHAIRTAVRAQRVGADHPAGPIMALAAMHVSLGVLGLFTWGESSMLVSSGVLALGVVTGSIGGWLLRASRQLPDPPPPSDERRHIASGRL